MNPTTKFRWRDRSSLVCGVFAACLMLLSLAGCTRRVADEHSVASDSVSSRPTPSPAATRPGLVITEWVALGNEPFWNVSIMPDSIVWRTPEHLEGVHFPPAARERSGNTIRWQTARTGTPASLDLSIESMTCGDGMSDRVYPYKATLKLDQQTFTGCAEQRSVWTGAGFALRIPPAWNDHWDVALHEGKEAERRGGASTVVEFACRPVTAGTRSEILVAVVVMDRARWMAMKAEAGPPPGDLLAERGERVWLAGLPQSQPFAAGSPDAARFEAMQLSLDQVKQRFALLPAKP